jgi:hypothetical protein
MYRERKAMIMKLWKTALAALVNLAVLLAFSATSTQAAVKKVSYPKTGSYCTTLATSDAFGMGYAPKVTASGDKVTFIGKFTKVKNTGLFPEPEHKLKYGKYTFTLDSKCKFEVPGPLDAIHVSKKKFLSNLKTVSHHHDGLGVVVSVKKGKAKTVSLVS